jgi:hypothetical protein
MNELHCDNWQYIWACMAYTSWIDCTILEYDSDSKIKIKFFDGLMSNEWIERYVRIDELRRVPDVT